MSDNTNPTPEQLNLAGSVVDKAIEYMVSQNLGAVAIASALLGGSLALLSRSMSDEAIVAILGNAIASVQRGELRDAEENATDQSH